MTDLNDPDNIAGTPPAIPAHDVIYVTIPVELSADEQLVLGKISSGNPSPDFGDLETPLLVEGRVPAATTWSVSASFQIIQTPPLPVPPTLSSIDPDFGAALEEITLSGERFDVTPGNNTVLIGGIPATVLSPASSVQLFVLVPSTLGVGDHNVTVEIPGSLVSNIELFTVFQPTISAIDLSSGRVSQEVSISGAFFSSASGGNIVKFGTEIAEIVSEEIGEIKVLVPPTCPASDNITVQVGPTLATGGPFSFTRNNHTLVSLVPNTDTIGATIDINGTNFSDILTDNIVEFDGIPATVLSASATVLEVEVPAGLSLGVVPVTVEIGGVSATPSSLNFTVV